MPSGRNRPAAKGGPSGVQRSYASQYQEHEPLFTTYEHLSGLQRADDALKMLRKIASLVKPIMRKRGWKVQVLAEFLPSEQNLLGLNINKGYKICIRLRYHNHPDLFLPLEQVVDTVLHELSHNVWGDHDSNFHRLWDELRDEHEVLLRKGYTGEGFLSEGQRLGGRGGTMPPQNEMRRLARQSAEKRKKQGTLSAGSGRRLGGTPLHAMGGDVRNVIADQVDRRNTINVGCGSGRADAGQLSQQPANTVFQTKAENDDANDRAIAQAIYELMEEEEERKLEGTFQGNSADAGLAWSKNGGLYDAKNEAPSAVRGMSEEEQVRLAIEQSLGALSEPAKSSTASPVPPDTTSAPPSGKRERSIAVDGALPPSSVSNAVAQPQETTTNSFIDLSSSGNDKIDPDQWTCEVCTLVNPTQFLACDACGVERTQAFKKPAKEAPRPKSGAITGQRARSTASSLAAVAPPPQKPGLGWNCGGCGAFMEHQWWTCSACGRMKVAS